jgi:hypothetical protein
MRCNALHSETIKYGRSMGLGPYKEWTPKEVEARTKGLVDIAMIALGVSPPKKPEIPLLISKSEFALVD